MSAIPSLTDRLFTAEGWIFLFLNCLSLLLARSYFSAKERQEGGREGREKEKEREERSCSRKESEIQARNRWMESEDRLRAISR